MRVRLHNIGPLRDADIEFSPLTVLVGPNGSGKTTFTSVTYALLRAHRAAILEALRLFDRALDPERMLDPERPPVGSRGRAGEVVDVWQDAFTDHLDFELRRCCSPDLSMLGRRRRGGKNAGPRISVFTERWALVFRLDGDVLGLETSHSDYRRPRIQIPKEASRLSTENKVRRQLRGDLPRRAIYFPAGRSGVVQTHSALSALMAGALSGGYFKDATIGTIPGATADFMQLVAQLPARRRSRRAAKVAQRIEGELLGGHVRLDTSRDAREFLFQPTGQDSEWPIENMATSVAELSPLILYLRHVAREGDAILIDEPEAHLHPESQVALASALVQLAGILPPVITATHSEFLVSALNNQLLRQAGRPRKAMEASEGLSVYGFRFHDSDHGLGVDVAPIQVKPTEGFEVEQFSEVAERVFDESIALYNRLHVDKGK